MFLIGGTEGVNEPTSPFLPAPPPLRVPPRPLGSHTQVGTAGLNSSPTEQETLQSKVSAVWCRVECGSLSSELTSEC